MWSMSAGVGCGAVVVAVVGVGWRCVGGGSSDGEEEGFAREKGHQGIVGCLDLVDVI